MIRESDIQKRLAPAVNGGRALWDFAYWLNSASWNMQQESSDGAVNLAMSLHHSFAGYDAGAYGEDVLRKKLRFIAAPSIIVLKSYSSNPENAVFRIQATTQESISWVPVGAVA